MINVFNQYTQRAERIFKGSRDGAKMIPSVLVTATLDHRKRKYHPAHASAEV